MSAADGFDRAALQLCCRQTPDGITCNCCPVWEHESQNPAPVCVCVCTCALYVCSAYMHVFVCVHVLNLMCGHGRKLGWHGSIMIRS
jgi:hypothetical protein